MEQSLVPKWLNAKAKIKVNMKSWINLKLRYKAPDQVFLVLRVDKR